jgi:hypothetical protein
MQFSLASTITMIAYPPDDIPVNSTSGFNKAFTDLNCPV